MGIVIILSQGLWLNITSSSTNKLNNQYETYQANVIGMVLWSQVKVEQQVGSLENIISVSANHLTGDISIVYNPMGQGKNN